MINRLKEDHGGAVYFPFEVSEKRPLRPLQGYAFKVPREFVEMFPELSSAADDLVQEVLAEGASRVLSGRAQTRAGQGFGLTTEQNQAVESRAMEAAREFFEGEGFELTDCSGTQPYDYVGVREAEKLYIEVKGTTTEGQQVVLTRNEVEHARRHQGRVALFVLSGIELVGPTDVNVNGSGGTPTVFWLWEINTGELTPISYTYSLPANNR